MKRQGSSMQALGFKKLKVCEIFYSIQGESSYTGLPFVFVRLTGCNLRCSYCDTTYAYDEGSQRTIASIIAEVKCYPCKFVLITGGEPLMQRNSTTLISTLLDSGYFVSIETNGSFDISHIDKRAVIIMDIKTPSSAMSEYNKLENLLQLKPCDEVKFVISDYADFKWSLQLIEQYNILGKFVINFSANANKLHPADLAEWILQTGKSIRLNAQLHKFIFKDTRGR